MGYANGSVDGCEESKGREDGRIRQGGVEDDGRTETVKGEGDISATIAEESARDPPEACSEAEAGEEKGHADPKIEQEKRVVYVSWAGVGGAACEPVVDSERESGGAISEDAFRERWACSRRDGGWGEWRPDLASTSGEMCVSHGGWSGTDDEEALHGEENKKKSSDELRPVEAKLAEMLDRWLGHQFDRAQG